MNGSGVSTDTAAESPTVGAVDYLVHLVMAEVA
jgi:hypothetical protein